MKNRNWQRTGLVFLFVVGGLAWPWAQSWWPAPPSVLLYGQAYGSAHRTATPVLVVVLHGDAPLHRPSYQYWLAQQVAQAAPDVVAVGLLRPGYADPAGHHSPGTRGLTIGDNYTPAAVEAVAATVKALRRRYHARQVILVGHSGGAVLAGAVLGRYPLLVDGALLVACPCDVPAFRRHMSWQQLNPLWWLPVPLLSPQDMAGQVRPGLPVRVVTGLVDPLALPAYSRRYVAALRKHHVAAQLLELPGQGHEIFLAPTIVMQIVDLATNGLHPRRLAAPAAHAPQYEAQQRDAAPDGPGRVGPPVINPLQKNVLHVGVNQRQHQRNQADEQQ
ncbi:alpha/beta hydrolase family protein [Hymenobacter sp. PAMC 26628]|uniref:alpha/beta hydrolase family protein n=1 Tax=Hymenobacter sp. PAMC 26628 TaxID=1484118 RepID=UPI000ADEA6E1|nr:prolyl oligopeptidase family serine peptidase [Hymenobacter sp. PAMC 26628]